MHAVNPQEVRTAFERDGYYVAKAVFDPARVAELERDFDRIVDQLLCSNEDINARWSGPEMERLGKDTIVHHTHNVQQFSSAWLRAILDPRFLEVPKAILGEDVVLHHTKLFQKPPERGAPFPMHQDWTYFPTLKDTMMAGIIHVSEATDEMGCFRVVPGTHKLGRVADSHGQHQHEVISKYTVEEALALEAEPGDVVWFHYFLIHGSMPNTSQKARKTVLVQVHAGDDRVEDGNHHCDERLPLCGWNHLSTRVRAGWKD
ncbi:MAG: phytanoyl-CoA dioxygenase family protein [Armatimonadetes bacterium]|nr:phytanoyl-CoA dioxygenase family protein [Armatimonadota bacterium]